jgi:hypothetical protein
MGLRQKLLSIIFIPLTACTIQQSGGRQAIEKGTINLGIGALGNVHYACQQVIEIPQEALTYGEVIEQSYESFGLVALMGSEQKKVIILSLSKEHSPSYCEFQSTSPIVKKTLLEILTFAKQTLIDLR